VFLFFFLSEVPENPNWNTILDYSFEQGKNVNVTISITVIQNTAPMKKKKGQISVTPCLQVAKTHDILQL
jgi:hypothetical protein